MGLVINTNVSAFTAYNNLRKTGSRVDTSLERLSSGLRINRAADDAAGLAISEKLRTQVNGLGQAQRNAQDGISLMQTAEGGLNETHAILQRMRTLAVQAANGTNSQDNLHQIQAEMDQLTGEIDHIAASSQFNGMNLLDGTFTDKQLQVGANAGDSLKLSINSGWRPAIDPVKAGEALWDVDKKLTTAFPGNFHVDQTLRGKSYSVDVAITTVPTSVADLAAKLNADPAFSATMTAKTGSYADATHTYTDVNLIIESKTDGDGSITTTNVSPGQPQFRAGVTGRPAGGVGGFGAADILLGPVDVSNGPQVVTNPGGPTTVGGQWTGFGTGTYTPPQVVNLPPTTTVISGGPGDAISRIDRAIEIVSRGRADLGAAQNRLEHTIRSLSVGEENMAASESRIRDADMAKEMSELSRAQMLAQAGTSMLAQANQQPQSVLKLLPNG